MGGVGVEKGQNKQKDCGLCTTEIISDQFVNEKKQKVTEHEQREPPPKTETKREMEKFSSTDVSEKSWKYKIVRDCLSQTDNRTEHTEAAAVFQPKTAATKQVWWR